MSETNRIRVPTNGHHPPPPAAAPDAALTPADPRIAFTPGQAAAGFGILAGLILLIVGSRHRGRRG